MNGLIEVVNLTKKFGDRVILNEKINLTGTQ